MTVSSDSRKRWYLLGLAAATHTFAAAIPFSCLPVLFEEISADLNGGEMRASGCPWKYIPIPVCWVSLIVLIVCGPGVQKVNGGRLRWKVYGIMLPAMGTAKGIF